MSPFLSTITLWTSRVHYPLLFHSHLVLLAFLTDSHSFIHFVLSFLTYQLTESLMPLSTCSLPSSLYHSLSCSFTRLSLCVAVGVMGTRRTRGQDSNQIPTLPLLVIQWRNIKWLAAFHKLWNQHSNPQHYHLPAHPSPSPSAPSETLRHATKVHPVPFIEVASGVVAPFTVVLTWHEYKKPGHNLFFVCFERSLCILYTFTGWCIYTFFI